MNNINSKITQAHGGVGGRSSVKFIVTPYFKAPAGEVSVSRCMKDYESIRTILETSHSPFPACTSPRAERLQPLQSFLTEALK
ncbi:MAG: hypothetical protein EOO61_02350 [Hymenobacter sp.]|nr:MAG: hypothetical protein EOO61_02350 [Hymenobacter sp.]